MFFLTLKTSTMKKISSKIETFSCVNFYICFIEEKVIPFLIFIDAFAELNIQCTLFYITISTYKWADTNSWQL